VITNHEDLVASFKRRLVDDLVANNVLRGAWAEEVVAFWLEVSEFPGQWSYYDLRSADGTTVSVKHSTGAQARFTVKPSKWAWDNELVKEQGRDGWRGGYDTEPQLWCHVYVFSWLPEPIELDRILDPTAWRFAPVARADMYRHQLLGSFTVKRLEATVGAMVPGSMLREAFEIASKVGTPDGVPVLDLSEAQRAVPAPPVAEMPHPA
jgi:hypothetical protein